METVLEENILHLLQFPVESEIISAKLVAPSTQVMQLNQMSITADTIKHRLQVYCPLDMNKVLLE